MGEFWTQALSGIVATIVGGLIVALIPLGTRSSRWQSQKRIKAVNRGGTQVIVDDVQGDVDVSIDDRRYIIVQENIEESYAPAKSKGKSDSSDEIWLVGIGAVLVATLFLMTYSILFWVIVGMIIGLAATLFLTIARTFRARLWSWRATGVVVQVLASIAGAGYAWYSVFNLTWRAYTITSLNQRVSDAAATISTPNRSGNQWMTNIFGYISELVKMDFPNGLAFVISILGAVVVSGTMLIWTWSALFDWNAYVGFIHGRASQRMGKRAYRYSRSGWGDIGMIIFTVAIVLFFASGLFLNLVDGSLVKSLSSLSPLR